MVSLNEYFASTSRPTHAQLLFELAGQLLECQAIAVKVNDDGRDFSRPALALDDDMHHLLSLLLQCIAARCVVGGLFFLRYLFGRWHIDAKCCTQLIFPVHLFIN